MGVDDPTPVRGVPYEPLALNLRSAELRMSNTPHQLWAELTSSLQRYATINQRQNDDENEAKQEER